MLIDTHGSFLKLESKHNINIVLRNNNGFIGKK